jgi:hypothetical protein
MLRPFVSRFLLPLVTGGPLHVSRPLDQRGVAALVAAFSAPPERLTPGSLSVAEDHAAHELGRARARRARALLLDVPAPPLDEPSFRLGGAVHDLLLLAHPALGPDRTDPARTRIAEAALALADLGPPRDAAEAVRRHSLLARLPEVVQPERLVSYWLGRQRFVGRTPPARVLAMPRLRRVRMEETRRLWLKEVGVPAYARGAWAALQRASPLGEALDPLRLDPPLAWGRILTVLRFPSLARLVADRVLELGLVPAGASLAAALFPYAAQRGPGAGGRTAEAGDIAFAVRFLAHVVWLDRLFGTDEPEAEGGDLGMLMVAAAAVDRRLVFPRDVDPGSDLGRRMGALLSHWELSARGERPERFRMAVDVARRAANAGSELKGLHHPTRA